MNKMLKSLLSASLICVSLASLSVSAQEIPTPSLFERMGGEVGARQIVADTWQNHISNPLIQNRFAYSDGEYVQQKVYEIFAMATGAEVEYTGQDMKSRHATMNISEMEFNAVVDDVLSAMAKNNVGQQEQNEVLAILWSVRPDIVNANVTTKTLTAEPEVEHSH